MPAQTAATLKTYFETGDTPTEAQFVDLIDTVDASTTEIAAGRGAHATLAARFASFVLAGGNVASLTNGAASGTTITLDSNSGFIVSGRIAYLLAGGSVEYNTIASVDGGGAAITVDTTIGAGGVPDDTYVSMISESEYQAAVSINYGNSVVPTLPTAVEWAAAGVFNVLAYGAAGDGTTDDRAAINAAITACNTAGGGQVYIPAGTYRITTTTHPNPSITQNSVGLVNYPGVKIKGSGMDSAILMLADDQGHEYNTQMFTHYNGIFGLSEDTGMEYEDFTIDGNYANQNAGDTGAKTRDQGLILFYAADCRVTRVRVRNVYGTNSGGNPSGEGFCIRVTGGHEITFTDCIAHGAGVNTKTASNISVSSGTNVTFVNCRAYDSGKAMGFTNNSCNNITYIGCHSYGNLKHGFNLEYSKRVKYIGCVAGGIPMLRAGDSFGTVEITDIASVDSTTTTIEAVDHGLATGDYAYIGGNLSLQETPTDIIGPTTIGDNVYQITKTDDDNFTILLDTSDTSLYPAYVEGGLVAPTLGNWFNGFLCQSGFDVEYIGCDALANGRTDARAGLVVKDNSRGIVVNGGYYNFNSFVGIMTYQATPSAVRFVGNPTSRGNKAFDGNKLGIKRVDFSTYFEETEVTTDTSIILHRSGVANSTGFNNGDAIVLMLDDTGTYPYGFITTISNGCNNLNTQDTVVISDALPSGASAGNKIYKLRPFITSAVAAGATTFTVSMSGRAPFNIVGVTDNGDGTVLVETDVYHNIFNNHAVVISGTTDYDGEFTAQPGGTTLKFVIQATYTTTKTGTVLNKTSTRLTSGDFIRIPMDNGYDHITTISGVTNDGAGATVSVEAFPYGASAGTLVEKLIAPNVSSVGGSSITAPSVYPINAVAVTNTYPFPVQVTSPLPPSITLPPSSYPLAIIINGVSTGLYYGAVIVAPGGTIQINCNEPPAWKWFQA